MEEHDMKQLKMRLDELEKLVKNLKGQGQGMSYYVNIEHAEFQGPIVDKLDYNFDKLDVKEVSGALNLGNNFGVRVGKVTKKEEGGPSAKGKGKGMSSIVKKQKPSGESGSEEGKPSEKQKDQGTKEQGPSKTGEQKPSEKSGGTPPSASQSGGQKKSGASKSGTSKSGGGTESAGGASSGGTHAAQIGGRTSNASNKEQAEAWEVQTSSFSQSPLDLGKRVPPGALQSEASEPVVTNKNDEEVPSSSQAVRKKSIKNDPDPTLKETVKTEVATFEKKDTLTGEEIPPNRNPEQIKVTFKKQEQSLESASQKKSSAPVKGKKLSDIRNARSQQEAPVSNENKNRQFESEGKKKPSAPVKGKKLSDIRNARSQQEAPVSDKNKDRQIESEEERKESLSVSKSKESGVKERNLKERGEKSMTKEMQSEAKGKTPTDKETPPEVNERKSEGKETAPEKENVSKGKATESMTKREAVKENEESSQSKVNQAESSLDPRQRTKTEDEPITEPTQVHTYSTQDDSETAPKEDNKRLNTNIQKKKLPEAKTPPPSHQSGDKSKDVGEGFSRTKTGLSFKIK